IIQGPEIFASPEAFRAAGAQWPAWVQSLALPGWTALSTLVRSGPAWGWALIVFAGGLVIVRVVTIIKVESLDDVSHPLVTALRFLLTGVHYAAVLLTGLAVLLLVGTGTQISELVWPLLAGWPLWIDLLAVLLAASLSIWGLGALGHQMNARPQIRHATVM